MATIFRTKEELQAAIKRKDDSITIIGDLENTLKPFASLKAKPDIDPTMSTAACAASLSLVGISVAVAITLIVTLGIVVIVAMLMDYKVKYKGKNGDDEEEVVFERN